MRRCCGWSMLALLVAEQAMSALSFSVPSLSRLTLDTGSGIGRLSRQRHGAAHCTGRTRHRRAPASVPILQSILSDGPTLQSLVRGTLQDQSWPYFGADGRSLSQGISIDENLSYSDGLQSFTGRTEYLAAGAVWRQQLLDEAPDASVTIVRVAQLDPGTVTVRYNVSWTPPNAVWLEKLGNAVPGWRAVKVDLLHRLRERSVFKFRNIVDLFCRAATTGELLVPLAVIQCTASLTFAELGGKASYVLTEHTETIDLLQSVQTGELQNRLLARDLLLYLDCKRPPGTNLDEWLDLVTRNVDMESVPGMGQFDIDGLEASDQNELMTGSMVALGYLTFSALVVAAAVGVVYFGQLSAVHDLQQKVDILQQQLDASLFL